MQYKQTCVINESLTSNFGIYEGLHINKMILYMSCIERGELIQVDIDGHPPIQIGSKEFFGNFLFLGGK